VTYYIWRFSDRIILSNKVTIIVPCCVIYVRCRCGADTAAENHRRMPEAGHRCVSAYRCVDILSDVLLGTVVHVRRDRQRGNSNTGQAGRTTGY